MTAERTDRPAAAGDRLRVAIATTAGPSVVRRITPEDPELRSVVCLRGTATALAISDDYDAFVRRPTGVVERDVGHRVFRVDVDRPIDDGRSWQLGLYIAHRLKAAGRLAEDDEPAAGIVWATGTVSADLAIGPVERVAEKARRSADLMAVGVPVLAVAAPVHADALPDLAEPLAAARVEEVLAHLGLAAPKVRRGDPRRRAGAAVALLLAVGGGFWALRPDGEAARSPPDAVPSAEASASPMPAGPPAFDAGAVAFEVLEARMAGDGCGTGHPVDPAVVSVAGVCAVAFRATNTGGGPVRLWLYGAVQGGVREYASRRRHTELAVGTLDPGASGTVRVQPPDWARRPIVVRGLLVLAEGDRPQVDGALAGIDLLSAGEVDTLVAGLRDLDVEVREIFHRVTPAR
ncbi:hypothetical protein T8K17_13205 [Thalassobaculum sp. OXR-137]|uniref:hypothetical protein n=1 Tax=Thalassobaculum sp. OXR-137 TaxID=3100173 RepID=UPI002AC95566|nr:hypothetical protein [Thalassobaculum sp. OXR-137]WPZ32199.1 hypothetical protein T8K17_13205 [Thalassobaculum sp. OXR-137]